MSGAAVGFFFFKAGFEAQNAGRKQTASANRQRVPRLEREAPHEEAPHDVDVSLTR